MSTVNRKIGNREKAVIHIAKAQIGMTETEYRAALNAVGAATSKDLTFYQFDKLMKNFKANGFQPTGKKQDQVRTQTAVWDKLPMLKKIAAQLNSMNLHLNYADGIAQRMFNIDAVSWCTPAQLHKVVAALEYRRKKHIGNSRLGF